MLNGDSHVVIQPFTEDELSVTGLPSHRIVLNVLKECLYCLACVGESSDIERFPVGIDTLTEFNLRE